MATELVTFKMESRLLKKLDKTVREAGFHSRTEFIRQALRDKVDEVRLKKAMAELAVLKGKAPGKTTDKQRAEIRENVFQELKQHLK